MVGVGVHVGTICDGDSVNVAVGPTVAVRAYTGGCSGGATNGPICRTAIPPAPADSRQPNMSRATARLLMRPTDSSRERATNRQNPQDTGGHF